MKKLLFLFTILLLISCSSDDDSSSNDSSEIVGTYSFVVGCDSTCDDDDLWYGYDCPSDYLEFTDTLFLMGFIDTDDCSDTNYLEEFSASYEITKTDSQEIHGNINFNGLDPDYENDYFVYDRSDKRLSRYLSLDSNTEASESNWGIKEVWQKN